jgi:hypothetical protein
MDQSGRETAWRFSHGDNNEQRAMPSIGLLSETTRQNYEKPNK